MKNEYEIHNGLNPRHREEIVVGSGVSELIANLNFWTVTDPSEVDRLLGRNSKHRWQHCDHLAPGWASRGVDPTTGESWFQGVQYKPDQPLLTKDGKPLKYLSTSGEPAYPQFLDTGDPTYWPQVLENRLIPLTAAEGVKKSGCLLTHKYAAVSVPGVWNGQRKGRLHEALEKFCGVGRRFNLCFDSDIIAKLSVQMALDRLGRLLCEQGCVVSVVTWDSQYKGIDDLCVGAGPEAVHAAIANALTFEEWRENARARQAEFSTGQTIHIVELFPARKKLVLVTGSIAESEEEALAYLGAISTDRDRLYVQGNSQGYRLVRILKAPTDINQRYMHVRKDNDMIEPLSPESLQHKMNREFRIYKRRWDKKQEMFMEVETDCPLSLCKQMLAAGRYPQIPFLRGLCYHPLLLSDGRVIHEPGYHRETGYLLQFEPSQFSIKEKPSREDAIAALDCLKNLLQEFCFKDPVDVSAAVALLLTSVSRRLYALAPMFCVSAHQPGTGKGTLVSLATLFATGTKDSGVTSYAEDEAEMTKKVVSTLLSGTPIINIDNVDRRLGGATLERILTCETYMERVLGQSKDVVLDTQRLWTANGNNLQISRDMVRRIVLIQLDAKTERPENRVFKRNVEAYTIANRPRLVSAAITVLAAYIHAGCPEVLHAEGKVIPPLGSFQIWDKVVRRPLLWLGMVDPVKSQETVRELDDGRLAHAELLETWYRRFGVQALTVRELIRHGMDPMGGNDFRECLSEICLDKQGQLSSRLLGYYLRRNHGVVVNKHRLVRNKDKINVATWSVEFFDSDQG